MNQIKHNFSKEFIDFINKFSGTYTEDDLIEIGKRHIALPNEQKNWNKLVILLNLNKTGNAFRLWIYRRLSDTKMEEELVENSQNSEMDDQELKLATLYKERTKNRDILNAYKKLLRDEARLEVFKDTFKETVSKLNKLPQIKYVGNKSNTYNEAILMLSDLHIGVICDNFYNKYNTDIAIQRLEQIVAVTIEECRLNKVKELTVLNLGDLIHGVIHTNARIDQQFDVISQVMIASELIGKVLNELRFAAPIINYRSVTDNHSRVSANLSEHIEKENFSRLIDWYLEERLKDSNINFIHDNLDTSLGFFELKNGKKIGFAHGHLDDINSCFQHFIGATKSFIDYMLLGHYHSEKAKSFQGTKVFVNGSIVGTEQYALSKRLFSNPSQTLLIFKENSLNNISIDLK